MQPNPVRKALIPAAGRGTRMLPFSKAVPKELAPIVATPTLELVVEEAARAGIEDVLMVVNPEKAAIGAYFSPHPDLEGALDKKGDTATLAAVRHGAELARFSYVDQVDPRGLGHAIGCGEEFAAGAAFAVLLPDDLIDDRDDLLAGMLAVHARYGGVVLAVQDVPLADISRYGCVAPAAEQPADGVVAVADLVEKPPPDQAPSSLAIIGRYVLPPEIFDALRETTPGAVGEIQITDAIRALCRAGVPVHAVTFAGRRYDTGNQLDYVKSVVQLACRHPGIGTDFRAWLREYVETD